MTLEALHKLTPAHISLCGWSMTDKRAELLGAKVINVREKIVGDHVVANEKLKQGVTLLEEEPFIRQLEESYKPTHCTYCFTLLKSNMMKCPNKLCKWSHNYCSLTCQRQHWWAEHKWLCAFPELKNTHRDVLFAFQGYIASRSRGKGTLPGLVSNIEFHTSKQVEEYRSRIKNGLLSKIFNLTDNVVESMVTIMGQIRCNTFAVTQTKTEQAYGSVVEGSYHIAVGRAIYLYASKFNHSCDPNALVLFGTNGCATHLKVNLVRQAEKGEELNISYGPLATKMVTELRRKKLYNDYFFECNCNACQKCDDATNMYQCIQCRGQKLYYRQDKCPSCNFIPNWHEISLDEEKAIKLVKEGLVEMDIEKFKQAMRITLKYFDKDSIQMSKLWDNMGRMYVTMGRLSEASKCIKASLTNVQKIFGKISVESAAEMLKLATIYWNRHV
ncbi:SET domain-containing protein [Rhizopus microsporus var. microsporus]|uniref:SET domain-containing protein n=1 Tax=Rhizopus microsporus var. microsporus TaxID=86635 RepID=A0A1X0RGH1_RHIZD|nr:SET domain-containing protein [Rhizopus microsporus var. microsporus]